MPEVQALRPDVIAQELQARAVQVGILVAGESGRRAVGLHGIADEHLTRFVDDVRGRTRSVAGDRLRDDADTVAEVEHLTAVENNRGLHLAADRCA